MGFFTAWELIPYQKYCQVYYKCCVNKVCNNLIIVVSLVSKTEAGEFISSFLDKFPKVAGFIKSTTEAARQDGYIKTLLNRRR